MGPIEGMRGGGEDIGDFAIDWRRREVEEEKERGEKKEEEKGED